MASTGDNCPESLLPPGFSPRTKLSGLSDHKHHDALPSVALLAGGSATNLAQLLLDPFLQGSPK